MGVVTRAKKRRLEEEEGRLLADRISRLPDDILGDIISLLPTKDGSRTQVLSSRWRHLWRTAPLILDPHGDPAAVILAGDISRILSAHRGPSRRFIMPHYYRTEPTPSTATRVAWLQSPALDSLQELEFSGDSLLLPSLVLHRFSSTLCVARFRDCSFPSPAVSLHWPLLKQLTLFNVSISESSLHTMLAGCPVLESLLLVYNTGCSRLQIVSRSLRSIGVHASYLYPTHLQQQLVIEDAPCLERLLYCGGAPMNMSVISSPRLTILGKLFDGFTKIQLGDDMVFQGSPFVRVPEALVSSTVKVLALHDVKLFPDAVINLLQCFPHLQKLYIDIKSVWVKYWFTIPNNLTSTLDIRLRKIVLRNYRGNEPHLNLARFFVSISRKLELMRFEKEGVSVSTKWIERQQRLLQIEKIASRDVQLDFVSPNILIGSYGDRRDKQVHDLSADPFDRFL